MGAVQALQHAGYVGDALCVPRDLLVGLLAVDGAYEAGISILLSSKRDAFVPSRDFFATLAGGADQQKSGDSVGVRKRRLHGDDAPHRVPDQDRLIDFF